MERTAPPQIVLAEYNLADVRLVREAFREHAVVCDLHVIHDGQDALAFIARLDHDENLRCPDLILLDLHLPKCNGEEILQRLRASERCARTPVVLLSSSDSPRDLKQAETNAESHFFRKPNSLEQFMELGGIVKEILSSRIPRRDDEVLDRR